MALYREIQVGVCLDIRLDEQGEPVCQVMSDKGTFYDDVKILVGGGSSNSVEYRPPVSGPLPFADLEEYEGSYVLLAWMIHSGTPVIVGSLVSKAARGLFLADKEAREGAAYAFDPDGRLDTATVDFRSYHNTLDGSTITLGSNGVTLDAQASNQEIRFQVAAGNHVRVSQAGFSTNDHVVLASHLLSKLEEIETAINTLGEKVAAIEAITATLSAPPNGGPVVNTGPNPIAPHPLGPTVTWVKGDDDDYRADCMRISEKTTGD